jgi:hypothetical protein
MDWVTFIRGSFILIFAGVLIYLAIEYTKKQKMNDEGFEIPEDEDNVLFPEEMSSGNDAKPSMDLKNQDFKEVDFKNKTASKSCDSKACFPKDKLTAEDLLPKNAANSKWAQVNPAGQGDVKDQNFLSAGYHVGINTVGSSLRNPNMQLRSEPPNPQLKVSPWNQTTIESDLNRRPLEINGCE